MKLNITVPVDDLEELGDMVTITGKPVLQDKGKWCVVDIEVTEEQFQELDKHFGRWVWSWTDRPTPRPVETEDGLPDAA